MGRLRLATSDEYLLAHPIGAVYSVLCDIGRYPEWWPGAVEVLGPLPVQVGTTFRLAKTRFVRWTVEVAELRVPRMIVLFYAGPLRGVALWRLDAEADGRTRVIYEIDIQAVPLWLRLVFRLWNLQPEHSRQIGRIMTALHARVGAMRARDPLHAPPFFVG